MTKYMHAVIRTESGPMKYLRSRLFFFLPGSVYSVHTHIKKLCQFLFFQKQKCIFILYLSIFITIIWKSIRHIYLNFDRVCRDLSLRNLMLNAYDKLKFLSLQKYSAYYHFYELDLTSGIFFEWIAIYYKEFQRLI